MNIMTIDVKELERIQREIEAKVMALSGPEMFAAMRNATMAVLRDAKIFAPVDTGRLRASLTPSVDDLGDVIQGVVGSNVEYAPYQEFGTGSKFGVAYQPRPGRQGGRFYLLRALNANLNRFKKIVSAAVKRIVEL